MFEGHPREGAWSSEKGSNLTPPLQQASHEDANMGDARFNGEVKGPKPWNAFLKPAEPLTRGGGAMAK